MSYDLVQHPYTGSSQFSAQAAHISGNQLAKPILLEDEYGYVMAIIPASHQLDYLAVDRLLNRTLVMASENELAGLFQDCELGAVPALGEAYGVKSVVDNLLFYPKDVYFEAGDHETLIRVESSQFRRMMAGAETGNISLHH
ncbi:MAG: YbaK/EbsC family protein [Gammaproteobacteria bacterium]|nr:YbaK/EbsC family protein [Gammaproteobacteria bacterium]